MPNKLQKKKSTATIVICIALAIILLGGSVTAYLVLSKDESSATRDMQAATTAKSIEEYLQMYADARYGYSTDNMDYTPYVDAIASYYRNGNFENMKLSTAGASDYEIVTLMQKDIEKYMMENGVGDMDPTLLKDLINISIAEASKDDPDYSNIIDSIRETYNNKFTQVNNSLDTLREQYNTLAASLEAGVSVTDTKVIEQSVLEVTNSLVDVQRKIEQLTAITNTLTGQSGGGVGGADTARVESLEKQVLDLATQLNNTHNSVSDDLKKLQDAYGKDLTAVYDQLNKQSDNSLTIIQQLIKDTASDASQGQEQVQDNLNTAKNELNNTIDKNKQETDKSIANTKTELSDAITQNKQETDKTLQAQQNAIDKNKQETDKAIAQNKEETDKAIAQNKEETDKTLQEQQALIDKNKEETDSQIASAKDELSNQMTQNKEDIDNALAQNKQETDKTLQEQQALIDKNKSDVDKALQEQQELIEQGQANIDEQLSEMQGDLTAKIDSEIAGTNTTIQNIYTDLSAAITSNGNKLDLSLEDIATLQARADALSAEDLQLQNNIDATNLALTQNITNVTNNVTTELASIRDDLRVYKEGMINWSDGIDDAIGLNEEEISNVRSLLNERVSELYENLADTDDLAEEAYNYADEVNSIATAAKTAADDAASKITALTTTVNDLSSKITQEISDRQSADASLTESVKGLEEDLASLKEEVASGKIYKARYRYNGTHGDSTVGYEACYRISNGARFTGRSNIVSYVPVADGSLKYSYITLRPDYFSNGGELDFILTEDEYYLLSTLDRTLQYIPQEIDVYYTLNQLPYQNN